MLLMKKTKETTNPIIAPDGTRKYARRMKDRNHPDYDRNASGIPASGSKSHGKPPWLQKIPHDEKTQNALADEMVAWSQEETAEAIEQFPLSKKYPVSKFYAIQKDNEYFKDALETARYNIGMRRERNARKRKEDGNIIMKLHPLYNTEYRDLLMEKVKTYGESSATTIQVIETPVPGSDMVPRRKVSDS
jgi:hypothetical protein